MPTPVAVAIYARISSDPSGLALGVTRQLEDCRKLAAERGWIVADEYVDNDVSAYSGKRRSEYERMLTDLRDGLRDAVIVYNLDRLTRRPIELEEFAALCESVGVRDVATVTADIDLGNDDGLFMARIFAAFAAKESGRRSERVRRKMLQNAEAGLPHGGNTRPYGFADDKITHRPEEVAIIRECAARVLAGESMRSIAAWLNAEEVPTVNASEWRTSTLRALLRSGRIAGLREHRGQVVGQATWEAIISPEQRDQVIAVIDARKVSGRRAPRRYLLSGMLRCGKCGHTLNSAARVSSRRYVCSSGPDHGGCGGIMIAAERVEELIADAVLFRLDTPELADVLAGRVARDDRAAGLVEQVASDQRQLEELAGLYAVKAITAREWMAARNPIEARLRTAERTLANATHSNALTGLVGHGAALRQTWPTLNLDRQHAIVRAVVDHAVIAPRSPRGSRFDPTRVEPVWLL